MNAEGPCIHNAAVFSKLPRELHYQGEPNAWVKATRPGEKLHSFLEAPCFDADGRLWLVDVPYGRIFSLSAAGEWRLELQYDGEPHGLARLPDGRFVITDYRKGLLTYDAQRGKLETLCDRINTENFRGLSDVAIAENGDIWFTDPGRSSLSDPTGRLFRLRAGHDQPDIMLCNVPYPNGVSIGPDGVHVYLAVTRANAIWRLRIDDPYPSRPMTGLFVQLSGGVGPDGIALDVDGRLFVAQAQAGRIAVFDELGDPLARLHTPGGLWTTAVAIYEPTRTLMIVEAQQGAVYRVSLAEVFGTESST
jgi:gluconolactonase